jgi:hypothetical protein
MAGLRRIPILAFAPVLALLTLTAWAFASPIGAGPDDDFHLVSSWCAGPTSEQTCAPGSEANTRFIPVALDNIECFAFDATRSASCQGEDWSWSVGNIVESDRGNFQGSYPPVYYAVTGLFTSSDIQTSAIGMRLLTVALFVALTTALFLLLPKRHRVPLVWGWLITTLPLGLFLFGSNNPSAWAIIGVGSSWISLLGYFESASRRKVALGAVFVLSVLIAAGSRGDAALYAGLGIGLVLILTVARSKRFWLDAILPVVMGLVALIFFLSAGQSGSGLVGFSGGSNLDPSIGLTGNAEARQGLSLFGLFANNLLSVSMLWTGVLGDGWGLGWLDTGMPPLVSAATIAVLVAVGFAGIGQMWGRKAIVLGVLVVTLFALPVYILQVGGDLIGEQVQPRYLLPLIVMLGGMVLLTRRARLARFEWPNRVAIILALSGAHFVALHLNIRRYVTGADVTAVNLDAGAEWWWDGPIGPNAVWLLGSLAYTLLVALLVNSRALTDEGGRVTALSEQNVRATLSSDRSTS